MTHPIDVTHEDFESTVISSDLPVLVDFWAPWCGPCRMMAPVLDELAEEMSDTLKIAKLNADQPDHLPLLEKYGVQGIPNMQLFKGGKVIKQFVGFRPKEQLAAELSQAI